MKESKSMMFSANIERNQDDQNSHKESNVQTKSKVSKIMDVARLNSRTYLPATITGLHNLR